MQKCLFADVVAMEFGHFDFNNQQGDGNGKHRIAKQNEAFELEFFFEFLFEVIHEVVGGKLFDE